MLPAVGYRPGMQMLDALPELTVPEPVAGLIGLGGPVLLLIALLSVVALTIVLAKFVQFLWLGVGKRTKADRVLAMWRDGREDAALTIARRLRAPHMDVIAAALVARRVEDRTAASEDVERVARENLAELSYGLRLLEVIAQVAPLLGLFGTVLGMIEAFQSLEAAGGDADPATLAGGIWVALLTTAAGLAVAIPVMLILSWFDSRIERERVIMESAATRILTGEAGERIPSADML